MENQHQNQSNRIVLSPILFEDIVSAIRSAVKEEVESAKTKELQDKLLSMEEARRVFQPAVSRVTLDKWSKEGRIRKQYLGRNVYFSYSELLSACKTISRYRRKC